VMSFAMFACLALRASLVVSFIVFARPLEPFADEVNIRLGGANARGRLLLERVKDVEDALEANCIDRTVGVAIEALDELEDASAFTLPWLGSRVLTTKLSNTEPIANIADDLRRET
jgi:hypothetical protein